MPKRPAVLVRSLAGRLLVPLLLVVVLILTLHAVVSFRSTRERLTELLGDGSERCSSLILGATHDNMLLNRKDEVQRTIERLARGPGVSAIRIYDTGGWVALSGREDEVGRHVPVAGEPCRTCHAGAVPARGVGRPPLQVMAGAAGPAAGGPLPAVLHHLSVIPNRESCAASGCHAPPSERPVLGILDVEMSTDRVREILRHGRRQMFWTVASLLLITGLVTTGFVNRLIHRPVSKLRAGLGRIARGDLDARIEIAGRHELAELAEAFNRMAADLQAARREVTEWSLRLEEKVVEKTDELQRAQRQVLHMEKMASLGKLSATVAHELNNPLSGLLTYARLVERGLARQELPPEVREELGEYLRMMVRESLRCGEIVKNLLLFSRRSGGAEMGEVDLEEVIGRSLALVRHHLEISNVELRREPLAGDPVLRADPGQLEQALVALFVNAVEAMSGPGYGDGELTVRAEGDAEVVRVHVSDTGVGIHPEVLPHIFEPFFSTKHEESGVGLGLAVVYGIVQRHGGSIEVDSEPGRGTTFHLTLPRRPRPDAADEEGRSPAAGPPREER
ncbi:MAG TPA: ATP-binding protein [Thermoanaerobaculia bacterium]